MRPYLIPAALAGGMASGFMIPPNVALESLTTPAIPMLTDPFSIKLVVPCPSCPYAEFKDKDVQWVQGKDNGLFLQVQVNTKSNTIELNGAQIYPPPNPFDLIFGQSQPVPTVSQVLSTVSLKDIERNPERYAHPLKLTGYGLSASTVHSSKETNEEVIKIKLDINSLEGQRINMAPIIITALKNPEVELMVLNVELQKQEEATPCDHLPILCKVKGLIQSVKHKMHGNCNMHGHMGMGHHMRPHHISAAEQHKEEEIKEPHRSHNRPHRPHRRPHHHHPHGKMKHHGHRPHGPHHHHTHHMHSFIHQVARALLTIVVPLLLGVLAGMVTYTVGMLLGTFIALIYIRWRSSRNSYQAVALGDEEALGEDEEFDEVYEKETYHDETPPTYIEVENK